MSQISTKIFMQVRKYPLLYDQTHSEYNNRRKREGSWEQITEAICRNQWGDLTLQEKAKKVQALQKIWKSSREKKLLEITLKNRERANSVERKKNSEPIPSTSESWVAPDKDEDSKIRDMDKELLVLYLLPAYKALNEEDKQEILHQCYTVMRERLQSYDNQQMEQPEDQ